MRRAIERVILVPGLVILVSVIVGAAGAIAPADATAAPPTAGRPTAVGRVVTARSVVASAPRRAAAPRTIYASNTHLWYSWRVSTVRWLGGTPVPTRSERREARREGWWGETAPAPARTVAGR